MTKSIAAIILALTFLPSVAFAQYPPVNATQGGTGWNGIAQNAIPYGLGASNLRIGTSSAFSFNPSAARLSFTHGSTTALTVTSLCISTDCRTAWPTAVSTATYPLVITASDIALDFGTTTKNDWNAHNTFSSFFATIASTTNATTTNLTVTGNVIAEGLTSALIVTGSSGALAEYAGTSCTDQFVRSLSALGAATCATVDISADTNLTAGRSLTLNSDAIDADAELYTGAIAGNLFASSTASGISTTTEETGLDIYIPTAMTITGFTCFAETSGTSTVKATVASNPLSAGTNILYSSGVNCGAQQVVSTSTFSSTALAAGSWLRVWVSDASPTGSRPFKIPFSFTVTKDD